MATASDKVDAPGVDLEDGKRSEFAFGDHTADQETQSTEPVDPPTSGKADPNKTGVY